MRTVSLFLICVTVFPAISVSRCFARENASPFSLSVRWEAGFLAAGITLNAAGSYALSRVHAPDPGSLHRNGVPGIDRSALNFHSTEADNFSDITVKACVVLPFLAAAGTVCAGGRSAYADALADLVMFAESSLFTIGLTDLAKGVFHRSRPYAYNSSLPLGKRKERNAARSFWSRHSAAAFNGAVFAAYVFQKHHPESGLVIPIWAAGLSAATATAILRVRAGQHFPTDVVAGAAAGSLAGWLVPRMHLRASEHIRIISTTNGQPGIGIGIAGSF